MRAECGGNGASAWSPINSFTTLNGRMGELESAEKPIEVSVFPNLNNGIFVASYRASQAGEATVTVTDLNGKVFFSQSLEVEPGVNETPINLRSAPQGLYILKVAQNGQTAFQKLVIE